jgi:predicted PurR-regulated permease PerM
MSNIFNKINDEKNILRSINANIKHIKYFAILNSLLFFMICIILVFIGYYAFNETSNISNNFTKLNEEIVNFNNKVDMINVQGVSLNNNLNLLEHSIAKFNDLVDYFKNYIYTE